jgi:hypothetical protein
MLTEDEIKERLIEKDWLLWIQQVLKVAYWNNL